MMPQVNKLQELIDILSNRQKEIRREIHRSSDNEYKNMIGQERSDNTAALRIMYWLKWVLKGLPYEERHRRDPNFWRWFIMVKGFHIHETFANVIGLERKDYWCDYKWSSPNLRYISQRILYYYIYNYLFPINKGGVFAMLEDDAVENEVWRTRLEDLPRQEYYKYLKDA